MIRSAALIFLFTATFACTGGGDDDDSQSPQADASQGQTVDAAEEAGFITALRLCTEVADSICERRGFCAAPDIFPVEECKVSARDACLDNYPFPDSETMTKEADLQTCLSDLDIHDCGELEAGSAPTSCDIE